MQRKRPSEIRLSHHLRTHYKPLLLGLALAVVTTVCSIVQPFWAGELIARVQDSRPVIKSLAFVIGLSLLVAFSSGLQQFILGSLTEDSTANWRYRFLRSFFALPLLSRQSRGGGWFSSRLVTDPPMVGRFIGGSVVQFVQNSILLLIAITVMFTIDAPTILFPIVLSIMSLLVAIGVSKPAGRLRSLIQGQNSTMSDKIMTAVSASPLIISSNADDLVRGEIETSVQSSRNSGVRLNKIYSMLGPISVTLMQIAYAGVFVVGGWRVASGHLGFPELITFLMLFNIFQTALQEVAGFPAAISECKAALGHFSEISRMNSSSNDIPQGFQTPSSTIDDATNSSFVFESVNYSYPASGEVVLQDLNLAVPTTGLTAIIGSSGSGKSTCLGLIEGFFFPDSGRVYVDGVAVTPETVNAIRENIAYVDQESLVIGGSIRENLCFSLTECPPDEFMYQILRRVGLSEWLDNRDGLETEIGVSGVSMSGGQKQRLAIARALLSSPKILLFDEPTSNLDGHTEDLIVSLLKDLATDHTVVVTAHRFSTIAKADFICVLSFGECLEQGSPEALYSLNGYYRDLVDQHLSRDNFSPVAN
ncbi:MAG: ABC transporter ATP-binding protein [Brevibacterium aurantiacum]|uniref:ABC transporter ATP-binding protein n=2 Tax=Brevibacterium aurantiacum TaxID=273384 RepID=A0A2A3Z964_BREAU|nr:ABC transporter ATP-binding protein [Brevibacterium aurantiacum]MDN5805788.1 ABC transporter ATP-binding protein/permease [Brevibacterium sp.]MDN6148968.1 ABC transporter ATP-binding protein/permease [Yaniella sp.]MDN5833740.1 ABC transporter ATP-binding protein/permease [Brevibacterium sp.]MDN6132865.1 ABC transporter ATP-binding protein/permease [Brevibacterium sp.]MDN6187647.1 ABC transporter ATP-binding protein/permease [Brevibacterium sp.]